MSVVTLRPDRVKWDVPIAPEDALNEVNERCIELPLGDDVAALGSPGRVLDAGCALLPLVNLAPAGKAPIAQIVHLTQNIASESCVMRGTQASYVSGDLRDLSLFADRVFDRVICLSTLEHVGFNNQQYGGLDEDKPESVWQAVRELWRVTKDVLFVTVPVHRTGFGNGRWRYFTFEGLTQLVQTCAPCVADLRYYVHGPQGWYGGTPRAFPCVAAPSSKPEQIACLKLTR